MTPAERKARSRARNVTKVGNPDDVTKVTRAAETLDVTKVDVTKVAYNEADDDEFQERAAIIEYDGGYPRAEAERRARIELGLLVSVG